MKRFSYLFAIINCFIFFSCMQQEEKQIIPVESLKFAKESIAINVEQNAVVPIEINPDNCDIEKDKILFEVIPEDLCKVSNIDETGCIITGLKKGSGVLTVSYEDFKDYIQIDVEDTIVSKIPYISLPEIDLKMQNGSRRTVVANLFGASKEDVNKFSWESSDKSIVSVEYSGSSAVLTANKYGSAVVSVSNSSCLYPAKMLVIVPEKEGDYFYLTTEDNVINVLEGENFDFNVSIIGGNDNDYSDIHYKIKEGSDYFSISGSGGKCSISAKSEGQGIIEIIHSKSNIPLTVQVNITASSVNDDIVCDTDFLYFDTEEKKEVNLSLISGLNGKWSFEKNNEGVADVILYNNRLVIVPMKSGECIITVSNTLISKSKEIKVYVDNIFLKKEQYSIRTSQNVIKMSEGDKDIPLQIELLGGNESDKSGFVWTVSDSSILKVDCADGSVIYSRSAVTNEDEKISGTAYISALRTGHASIEISHVKSENKCTVDVIVYPKGSLNSGYVDVSGETFLQIKKGESYFYKFNENVDYSKFTYKLSDEQIVSVIKEADGFIINSINQGNVLITFYSEELKTPFSVNVVCFQENENDKKIIKSDASFVKGFKDEVYYFSLDGDFSSGIGKVSLNVEDSKICRVTNIQEIICIEFMMQGSTLLKVNVEGFDNELIVPLYCVEKEVSLKYPYDFYGDSFVSVNCEKEVKVPLILSGSSEGEFNSVNFEYDEKDVQLSYDGKEIKIIGLRDGRGSIKVSHPKVYGKKEISYIVYKTYSDSLKKLSIWTDKKNYTGVKGEKILIKINSSDNYEHVFQSEVENIQIASCIIDGSYMLVQLLEYGKTSVHIKCEGAFDECIYINVVSNAVLEKDSYFNLPVIVKGVINQPFEIKADYSSEYNNYISNLEWICPQSFKVSKNHASASFSAQNDGVYEIYAEIKDLGIRKKVLVYIYKDDKQMNESNSVYLDNFTYNLIEGEEIDLTARLFSEWKKDEIISGLKWEIVDGLENVKIDYNGLGCKLKALKEGTSRLIIKEESYGISFEFIIYVTKKIKDNFYNFKMERMVLVKPGEVKNVSFMLEGVSNSNEYKNVSVQCDSSFVDVKVNDNGVSIYALQEGNYYCTLRKSGWNDFLFLVCCRNDIENEEVPFLFSSENVKVMNTGSISNLYFYSNDNSQIRYSINGEDCIEIENNGEYLTLKGIKEGECRINADYSGITCSVKVIVGYKGNDTYKVIKVPQFVFLRKGHEEEVTVWSETSVEFESLNIELSLVPNGNSVVISSDICGIYELKAATDNYNYKIIKVVVYENEGELSALSIINIPQRIYNLRKGDTINIDTFITGNEYNEVSYELSSTDFAEISYNSGTLSIKGKEEGTFTVRLKYYNDVVTLLINIKGDYDYVYTQDEYTSIPYYLSTDKNYSFIKIGNTESFTAKLNSLNGSSFNNNAEYIWTVSDTSVISIITSDNICSVKALKKGKVKLYCSSTSAANIISIDIEVGSDYDLYEKNMKFIHVQNTVIYHDMSEESTVFEADAINLSESELSNLYVNISDNEILSVSSVVNNKKIIFTVKGKKCGKALISIGTPQCDIVTKVSVIISHTISGESVYLTTSQNYSVLRVGETISLSVKLKNADEYNVNNFRWTKISGGENITLIGNGSTIQSYGIKEGMCMVRCTHVPSGSFIDLYVLVSNLDKTVKYMTCDALIIETDVSSVMNSFMCNIIGGDEKDNGTFKFTVDKNDVISVVSSSNIFYYRGLKEGTANLHVSNEKSGCINSLDIVFIVKQSNNSSYIKPSVSSVYLKQNSSGTSVSVDFVNCSAVDSSLIDWFIYSQSMNTEVVSIVSSGNKCVIKPLNNGYATIRANYEPLGLSCTIGVYVDDIGKINFLDKNIKVVKDESVFAPLVLPQYVDDIANYITFKSLDESICKAFGTGKVCCIEAIKEGSCVVRAINSLDDSYCDIGITVVEEKQEKPKIILSKNTLVLNPRSEAQLLYASLGGAGLNGFEGNDIKWSVKNDTSGCVSLFPSEGNEVYLRLKACEDSSDSDYGRVKCGQAVIEVSHELCDVSKTIYVTIQEQSNFFTLDNYSVNLEVSNSKVIKCKIVNGKPKNYDDVRWSVSGFNTDKYGNKVNVIKLLNDSGESCSIYGLNEGICTLSAFYFGTTVTCEVEVTSARTFKISGSTSIQMIPDVVDDNYIDVPYVLRPSNTVPIWNVQNVNSSSNTNIVSVDVIEGKSCIRIRPLGSEGQAKILGTAVGVGQVSINVNVKFNPVLQFIDDDVSSVRIEMNDSDETSNIVRYSFSSYPSIYYVKVSVTGKNSDCIKAFIESSERKNGRLEGKLVIQALKECPDSSALVTLQQYTDPTFNNVVSKKESKIEVYVGARYSTHRLQLGFRRGAGGFSFREETINSLHKVDDDFISSSDGKYYRLWKSGESIPAINMADGEQHYFVIKDENKHSYTKITDVEIVKNDFPEFNFSDDLMNKLSESNKSKVKEFLKNNLPKVTIGSKNDGEEGSYVFDIVTGEKEDSKIKKYGRDWSALSKNPIKPSSIFASKTSYYKEKYYLEDANKKNKTLITPDFSKKTEQTILKTTASYFTIDKNKYIYNWKPGEYEHKKSDKLKPVIIDNIDKNTESVFRFQKQTWGPNEYFKDYSDDNVYWYLKYDDLKSKGIVGNDLLVDSLSSYGISYPKTLKIGEPETCEPDRILYTQPFDIFPNGKSEEDEVAFFHTERSNLNEIKDIYLGVSSVNINNYYKKELKSGYTGGPSGPSEGDFIYTPIGMVYFPASNNDGHGNKTYLESGNYSNGTMITQRFELTFDNKEEDIIFYLIKYTFGSKTYYRIINIGKNTGSFEGAKAWGLQFLPISNDTIYFMGKSQSETHWFSGSGYNLEGKSESFSFGKIVNKAFIHNIDDEYKSGCKIIFGEDASDKSLKEEKPDELNYSQNEFYDIGERLVYKFTSDKPKDLDLISDISFLKKHSFDKSDWYIKTEYSELVNDANIKDLDNWDEAYYERVNKNNHTLYEKDNTKGFHYYHDYKTDWDFKVYYGDLKITYTDISGTNNVVTFPLYVEYYNNAADYYDYSLGSQSSSNKDNFKNPKYNAPTEAVIFRDKEFERLK